MNTRTHTHTHAHTDTPQPPKDSPSHKTVHRRERMLFATNRFE